MQHSCFFLGFAVIKARKTALSSESQDYPVCILQRESSCASILYLIAFITIQSGSDVNKPELLAPAGTMEKLKCAIRYGADAVYMGGPDFGLRNMAGNFTLAEMPQALAFCHEQGVRCYLTINSYPADHTLGRLENYLQELAPLPFDAYIVSDPGVLRMIRRISPEREIHLSTQANTINHESVLFWQGTGDWPGQSGPRDDVGRHQCNHQGCLTTMRGFCAWRPLHCLLRSLSAFQRHDRAAAPIWANVPSPAAGSTPWLRSADRANISRLKKTQAAPSSTTLKTSACLSICLIWSGPA
jgi:Collagenase and related proteases